MKNILSIIQEKKVRLDQCKPFPKAFLANMDEWYKIELTYTSNAIEGNTLTRQETALVVEKGITVEGKSITEHLEAINHAKAYEYVQNLKIKSTKNITERVILDIHAIILQNIDNANAGKYRNISVRIAGSRVILPNPMKIPKLMHEFITWLHISEKDPVETAIKAHFKLVSIHPFTDGNGRVARLLMNLILMQSGYPPAIIRKEDRKKYIDVIEKGQFSGDLTNYYEFMYKNIEKSLDIYLDILQSKEQKDVRPKKLLKIGGLAKGTQETVATIRYWTKEGLLPVSQFSKGGYQLYSPSVIEKVKNIRKLQKEKRLTIAEMKRP